MTNYASIVKRGIALLIDCGVLMVLGGVLGFALNMVGLSLVSALAIAVLQWGYYAYMESSSYQGTIGKVLLGIKVVDLQGKSITFTRATGRYFAKYLSGMVLALGYIMAIFTKRRQGLHDLIAGTLVVE